MSVKNLIIRYIILLHITLTVCWPAAGENIVTCEIDSAETLKGDPYRFRPLQLAVPALCIGVGIVGLESDWLKYQNRETRDELQEHYHPKITVDDFTQYSPLAAMYALKLAGIRGMHDYRDMTVIAGTAYLLMGLSVRGLKAASHVERPDGTTNNSFPSGHTATAFAGAELLRREYWSRSPWIGVAGYAVAAGTGFLRMYNNRHWLTDVIAGAGIGILSVQAAYWLYPVIARTLFGKSASRGIGVAIGPSMAGNGAAVYLSFTM